ncbi:MAG TPA: IspD/TarI family cytidylyltransferase [Mycobacteriales bacterium]|nr:IspD/TarI family cytidylyltransferase [Mycobacteriales bacterium]
MANDPRVAAVVLAGGSGSRVGADRNKVYLPLAGRSVISWSLDAAAQIPGLTRLLLVVRAIDRDGVTELLQREVPELPVEIVEGGATRHDSEWCALRHLEPRIGELDVVVIHDGARPLAPVALMREVVRTAAEVGGAVPGYPGGALARLRPDDRLEELPGEAIRVQTPQAFAAGPLLEAYRKSQRDGFGGTDTAACIERYTDLPVHHVPSSAENLKITRAEDFPVAETILALRLAPPPPPPLR